MLFIRTAASTTDRLVRNRYAMHAGDDDRLTFHHNLVSWAAKAVARAYMCV